MTLAPGDRPLLAASARHLARLISSGQISSRRVVQAHVDQASASHQGLNALVAERFEAALREADAADAVVRSGAGPLGPLHGVPCTIKESFSVQGMPWTAGLARRSGIIADGDAPSVARLRAAGAIVLGVTNTSELCLWMESSNPVYGRTTNPYHPGRTAGGSSGGEGAIIGAGASPFGLGSDIGGSIRLPAFFCGVFGHKPTPGVVPNAGQWPVVEDHPLNLLSTGPLCRKAEDLFPLLQILADPRADDGHDRPVRLLDPSAVHLDGLRVWDVPDSTRHRLHPVLRRAQQRAAAALQQRGANVTLRYFPELGMGFDLWSAAMTSNEGPGRLRALMQRRRRDLVGQLLRSGGHTLPAIVVGLIEEVTTLFPGRVKLALAQARVIAARMAELLQDGVLLFPTWSNPAPRHHLPLLKPLDFVHTAIFNVLGLPVTQVPLGLDASRRPLGVQVVSAPGNDHLTLAVALELERAFGGWVPPWEATRRPAPDSARGT